ncbi:MAG: ABC transporter permease subunit [Rhizobiales bacterium]|nr:ABC transporter permease subunit [Hyphomicrobiales bacterium]
MVGRQRSSVLAAAYVVLVLLFLYLPVAVTVMFSFADSPRLSMPIEGLTLDWYRRAFSNPLMGVAVRNSVILAAVSAIAAGALGARGVLLGASLLPSVIPLLVIGISLAVAFSAIGWLQGLRNAAFGHVLVCLPFVVLTMNARLETFDFSILEAARDLGASPFRAFLDITLPIIRPSILGAALLAAALSLDEFVVTWFNIGRQQTLPVLVWGLVRRGVDPSINAVASLLLFSLICLVGISNLSAWRRRR